MLQDIGFQSMEELFASIPDEVLLKGSLDIPEGKSELEVRRVLEGIAAENKVYPSIFRGAGAYRHYIPAMVKSVISRKTCRRPIRRTRRKSARESCSRFLNIRP